MFTRSNLHDLIRARYKGAPLCSVNVLLEHPIGGQSKHISPCPASEVMLNQLIPLLDISSPIIWIVSAPAAHIHLNIYHSSCTKLQS